MSSTVPTKRLRLSIWVGNVPLDDATVKGGRMIVDDLTMLMTIVNLAGSNVIAYEPNVDAERTAREVAVCHKYGIQCLAGLSLTFAGLTKHPRVVSFEHFLRQAKKNPALLAAKAEEIVARIDEKTTKGPRALTEMFDGVGFDNENLDGPDDKPQLVEFYRAVAAAVTKAPGCGGRFVSVANAPLSSPIRLVLSSRLPPGSPPKLGEANTFMRNHDHTMNAGVANLVMRPMCYDTFSAVPATPASKREQWHKDALDYAVGTGGTNTPPGPATRASVFQMGFKNSPGFNNDPANFGKPGFQNLDGIVEPGKEMEEVCWRMRQAGVGVALFAFPTSGGSELAAYFARVARYNFALNGAATASGPDWSRFKPDRPWADTCTPGPATQPVQVPIGKDGQARLGKP